MSEKHTIKNKKDVFEESIDEFMDNIPTIEVKEDDIVPVDSVSLVKKMNPDNDNWKELRESMLGVHAERFNKVMSELPDREFARLYLKSLEYFKPKIVRGANDKDNQLPPTINIQINRTLGFLYLRTNYLKTIIWAYKSSNFSRKLNFFKIKIGPTNSIFFKISF